MPDMHASTADMHAWVPPSQKSKNRSPAPFHCCNLLTSNKVTPGARERTVSTIAGQTFYQVHKICFDIA